MAKTTVASLCEHISKMNVELLEAQNKIADLESEVSFLKKANLCTSVAGVVIFIILGFFCNSMF